MRFIRTVVLLALAPCGRTHAQPLTLPKPDARRLEVLFFGAPTAAHPAHDPVTRYRVLKRHLGTEGINFSYTEDPAEAFNPEVLSKYDALLMYGNWQQNDPMPPAQLKALTDYVEGGGGFLPIHCASACYGGSPEFVRLVGARFKSHETGVFKVTNVNPQHPVMREYQGFEAWDETYVHDQHGDDRVILEMRGDEPWTWVRQQGKGRVFYTAAGHDHRVWDQPEFHNLVKRAIFWTAGPEKYRLLQSLKLPNLREEEVMLPGYRDHKAVTRAQSPLSPVDSMKFAQVPVGFQISLFACEPDILNPIFVNWDHKGRAYVIQTTDYPNNLQAGNLGHDKIIICEDRDGDGRADKFTTFADRLSIPSSLTFANGGVICTNGSEILFLKDTNGDDKADELRVLFTGFGMGDTHAGPSNLSYGQDGWIYATVGYSGFHGTVGGENHQFGAGVFRFMPDGSKLEYLQRTTNNTWGLGINSDFDLMGSTANANPSFFLTHPISAYAEAGIEAPLTPRADEFRGGPDNPAIFNPSSDDIRQVDVFDSYTAAAGHAFYTSSRFPETWREKTVFINEPTGKLVGVFDVRSAGAGFKSVQRRNNIYNSADAWSGPVCAVTGPDGALWICDWYNLIIQHNPTPSVQTAGMDAKTGKGNAYESPVRDVRHGRIYRIHPTGSANDPNPGLDPTKPATLAAGLDHPNLLWRLHAQRLIVENVGKAAAPKLRELANAGGRAAPHALQALQIIGELDAATVGRALASPCRAVRRAAIQHSSPEQIRHALIVEGFIDIDQPRELADCLVVLSRSGQQDPAVGAYLVKLLKDHLNTIEGDIALKDGWRIAALRQAASVAAAAKEAALGGPLIQEVTTRFNSAGPPVASSDSKPRAHLPDPAVHERGKAVYGLTCVACHGADGKGVAGAFPPLDGSDWLTGDPSVPIRIVRHGLQGPVRVGGVEFNNVMPALPDFDAQKAADVLTYVRQSWSNDASPVTPQQVSEVWNQYTGRIQPWTAKELGR